MSQRDDQRQYARPRIRPRRGHPREIAFNLTPMIDIVFLLIIFFMLVCRFIQQENYQLVVPDRCESAVQPEQSDPEEITASVVPLSVNGGALTGSSPSDQPFFYAIRNRQYHPGEPPDHDSPGSLVTEMAEQLRGQALEKQRPVVLIRADRHATYGTVQQLLMAVAQADITRIRLAVLKADHADSDTIEVSQADEPDTTMPTPRDDAQQGGDSR